MYHIGKSLNRQIVQLCSFFLLFSKATAITVEAITMTQTRRSSISPGVLHSHHSVLKEIDLFSSDSQAPSGECLTLHAVLFRSVPHNKGYAYTGNTALSMTCSATLGRL